MTGTRSFCQNNGSGIHDAFHLLAHIHVNGIQPDFGQCLKHRYELIQPFRKRLIAGEFWRPIQQVVFGILVNRRLLESPLADASQAYRYALFIAELGTEMVALTLHDCFDCATIVADSAIELDEICLPHTFILCSFALFFYPFSTFDSHF